MNKRIAKKILKSGGRYSTAQWREARRVLRQTPTTSRLSQALAEWFAIVGPVFTEVTYTYTISKE